MAELEKSRATAFSPVDGCTLSEGLELEGLENSGEEEIMEVSPCVSERGKIMAEVDLSNENRPFLDMGTLCLLLNSYENHFADLKCSPDLGVARFMWKARRIYIYKKGKFEIRFAHSREDAENVLDSLKRLVLGSILCKRCSRPSVECALGGCDSCLPETPEFVKLGDSFNTPILLRGVETLRSSAGKFRELKNRSLSGKWPAQVAKSLKRNLKEAIEHGMRFALETRNLRDLRIGITLSAVARESLLMLDLEHELAKSKKPEIPKRLEKLLDKLHKGIWKMEESIVQGFFKENFTRSKQSDEDISEVLEIFRKITGSKARIFGKINNDFLKNFEKQIKKTRRCIRLLANSNNMEN